MRRIEKKDSVSGNVTHTKEEMIQRVEDMLFSLYYEDVEFIYRMMLRLSERR